MMTPSTNGQYQATRRGFFGAAAGTAAAWAASRSAAQDTPVQDTPAQDHTTAPPGPREAEFQRDYEPPKFKPSWSKAQVNRQMAQDFVIFAHSELESVKRLLEREPGLINASIDWGGGDFETALGGASHMGRHDIVEFLLERGARIDLFAAAMLGQLDAIRSFLTLQPKLIDATGPHGFTLHFHAQVGGERSAEVLEYLQSIKQVELKPIPFLRSRKD